MSTPELIGQIIGIVALVEGFFIYFSRKRSNILIFKLINDVMNATVQVLLGAFTGAAINIVAVGRESVFYNRGKHKWANSIAWLFVFMAVIIGVSILTWAGPISLVPMIGSVIAVAGFYAYSTKITRTLGIISSALWLVYQIVTLQIGAMIGSGISITAAIIGLVRDGRKKNAAEALPEEQTSSDAQSPEELTAVAEQ